MYYGVKNLEVKRCTFEKLVSTTQNGYPLYALYCNNISFIKNKIKGFAYQCYFNSANTQGALSSDELLIANNMFITNFN